MTVSVKAEKGESYTVEPLGTDTSLIRTLLYYGQFPMYRQNSHTFPLKKPLQYGPFLMRTTDTKFGPWEQIHTNVTSLLRTLRDKVSIICGICTISCRQIHKH